MLNQNRQLCNFWERGDCRKGDACRFYHPQRIRSTQDAISGASAGAGAGSSGSGHTHVTSTSGNSARERPVLVKIHSSVWTLKMNSAFNRFKINAPGSQENVSLFSTLDPDSQVIIDEIGGGSNCFSIVPDDLKWNNTKVRPVTCVIFRCRREAYENDPIVEEKCLFDSFLEGMNQSSVDKTVQAHWRLGQSCLVKNPNVCIGLVGKRADLDLIISNRISTIANDYASVLMPVPLTLIINNTDRNNNIKNFVHSYLENFVTVDDNAATATSTATGDDLQATILSALPFLKVDHHIKSMTNAADSRRDTGWECKLTRPLGELSVLVMLQVFNKGDKITAAIDLPGGKRNVGEDCVTAAEREFQEETGINLGAFQVNPTTNLIYTSNKSSMSLFVIDLPESEETTGIEDVFSRNLTL
jgi:hypothetical protein